MGWREGGRAKEARAARTLQPPRHAANPASAFIMDPHLSSAADREHDAQDVDDQQGPQYPVQGRRRRCASCAYSGPAARAHVSHSLALCCVPPASGLGPVVVVRRPPRGQLAKHHNADGAKVRHAHQGPAERSARPAVQGPVGARHPGDHGRDGGRLARGLSGARRVLPSAMFADKAFSDAWLAA